jgi:hypothetical protein
MAREIGGVGERLSDAAAFDDGDEIEEGIAGHVRKMGAARAARQPSFCVRS